MPACGSCPAPPAGWLLPTGWRVAARLRRCPSGASGTPLHTPNRVLGLGARLLIQNGCCSGEKVEQARVCWRGWLLNHICRTLIYFQSGLGRKLVKRVLIDLRRPSNLCLKPGLPEAVGKCFLKQSVYQIRPVDFHQGESVPVGFCALLGAGRRRGNSEASPCCSPG